MAYIEIMNVNHNEGTNYRVIDWTAEKLSKAHPQDLYHYPEGGDIIIMIDDLEIANMSSGKILQLLNSANSIGIITHAICRCNPTKQSRPSDAHHPPKPLEEKEGRKIWIQVRVRI